jgi:hypothetical protein
MNTPVLTWRLRRISRSLWWSVRAGERVGWLGLRAPTERPQLASVRPQLTRPGRWLHALRSTPMGAVQSEP